jgi:hypothetical protein
MIEFNFPGPTCLQSITPPGIRPYCMTLASNFKCPGVREYVLNYGLRR